MCLFYQKETMQESPCGSRAPIVLCLRLKISPSKKKYIGYCMGYGRVGVLAHLLRGLLFRLLEKQICVK